MLFGQGGVLEGVAGAGDLLADDAHGEDAEAGGTFEQGGDAVAGDEAELGVFGDLGGEAVGAGEGTGKAGDFAGTEGAGWIEGMGRRQEHADGAAADEVGAGHGIAGTEERGAFANGQFRGDAIELADELGGIVRFRAWTGP